MLRVDIKMGKGKLAAQAAHASLAAAELAMSGRREWYERWKEEGQRKIVLRVNSLDELISLHQKAQELGVPSSIIQDKGLTQIKPGTITCIGIGPAPDELIDRLTGNLKLL